MPHYKIQNYKLERKKRATTNVETEICGAIGLPSGADVA
jgi:hypothetical protein